MIAPLNIGLCENAEAKTNSEKYLENELKRFRASEVYKLTKTLSRFANKADVTLSDIANRAKTLNIYDSATLRFGGWCPVGTYLNKLPFDLDENHRYYILTFTGKQEGFRSSMLLKIKWDKTIEKQGRFKEMLDIFVAFYTNESFSHKIVRSWFNPWNNKGEFQVQDERKKNQDPNTYWTTAVGKEPDKCHIEQLKFQKENKSHRSGPVKRSQ